jgi:uncharacterized Zn-binding protein involved in type VI secretion
MGKPAARVGDMHVCPMLTPGVPPVPHVGGPILPPGCPTVLIGGMPAAGIGDMCTCVGPPDTIILGSISVLVGGKPIARLSDNCAHGGMISVGLPTVLIGESGGGSAFAPPKPGFFGNILGFFKKLFGIEQEVPTTWQVENAVTNIQALAEAKIMMAKKKGELIRWNKEDKLNVKKWMGDDSEATRQMLLNRIDKENAAMDQMNSGNFEKGPKPDDWSDEDWNATYAYVYPNDQKHIVHVGPTFENAQTSGSDSKADTIIHENSHFSDVAGTKDEPMDPNDPNSPVAYGKDNCLTLASNDPNSAKKNADNFSYYMSN